MCLRTCILFYRKELPSILSLNVVKEIAEEVARSPAQVLLRHMIQKNIVVIPKSINPERVKQNFEVGPGLK